MVDDIGKPIARTVSMTEIFRDSPIGKVGKFAPVILSSAMSFLDRMPLISRVPDFRWVKRPTVPSNQLPRDRWLKFSHPGGK